MVDRYYREIEDVENDIENAMQISSILLKLKGYDNDLEKIDTNENNISSNLSKIEDNKTNISTNLEKIDDNKTNISDNLEKINDIKSILPKSEIFKKAYNIKNQSFRFTRNIVYFKLLEIEIENNFNKDGRLEFDNYIYYRYDNLQRDHHRLQHEYRIFDDKNNLLYKKILNKTNTSDLDFDKNIMLVKDNFYVTLNNNYNRIKIILDLFRVYRHGTGNFNLELINESFVNITYLDKNDISLKIEDNENNISSNLSKINNNSSEISTNSDQISTNKNNISTNVIKITSNENDILYNLNEINYLKNNSSKSYLKNVYNILIYDKETKIDFKKNIFYEKIFDVDASKNDFIEINFKIKLEYNNTDYRYYVKSIYELLDENNNSLYIKSVNNNHYNYFSNKCIIDENIFYNFTNTIKKLKFVIKFQKLSESRIIYVYYKKDNNYRLIIKNYGV